MSIRKQWLIVLISTALVFVAVNTLLLTFFVNRNFQNYTRENYEMHIGQIKVLAENFLTEEGYTTRQIQAQLQAHLSDPITGIKLHDSEGILIAEVNTDFPDRQGMMGRSMMDFMMGIPLEEIEVFEIISGENPAGQLTIYARSSITNSMATRMFTIRIIGSTFLAFGIVLIIVILAGITISRQMSRDLIATLDQAVNIEIGNESKVNYSKVTEIKALQQNLEILNSKLKLKQKSRKNLMDELMHQARTPLTILKTHLEALNDGMIVMDSEKIKLCESQIENITAIMNNMGKIIDANREISVVRNEEFELKQTLRQIINGLKLSFQKKEIELTLVEKDNVILYTDKNKLSQSIYNILTNALKFTPPGGKVTVSYAMLEDFVEIIIEDTGSGISKEDQKYLFDAYYRGKNSLNIPGEGLGLFIAKDNLDKINGRISVESEIGKGSKFVICQGVYQGVRPLGR